MTILVSPKNELRVRTLRAIANLEMPAVLGRRTMPRFSATNELHEERCLDKVRTFSDNLDRQVYAVSHVIAGLGGTEPDRHEFHELESLLYIVLPLAPELELFVGHSQRSHTFCFVSFDKSHLFTTTIAAILFSMM